MQFTRKIWGMLTARVDQFQQQCSVLYLK